MIPPQFDYTRVTSAEEAVAALVEHGDEAKLLAGGHSLIPLLKLRLAQPSVLIDIGPVTDLSYVRDEGEQISIGGLTRHRDLERSELLAREIPLLAECARHVGDPQVRNRGTIGGSLSHGDGASDLPAVVLALGGTIVAQGPGGRREVAATEFFRGFLETALADDEILVEVRLPKAPGGWSFQKFNRRAQDWAIVGVALGTVAGERRVGLVNMASVPVRATATEEALAAGASAADAAALAAEGTEPPADIHGSSEYRSHLARVLVGRALTEAGVG